jgi:hypothetical protein
MAGHRSRRTEGEIKANPESRIPNPKSKSQRTLWVLGFGIWVLTSACSAVPPLSNTHESPESLARAVLEAFASRDRGRLEALALNEREFRDHVWRELPAAQPGRNLPFSYVWGDLRQKSDLRLSATLAEHGGQQVTLERVRFSGVTSYDTYRVHREAVFEVREGSGARIALRVCGSMVEKDGAWKVFSYVVDE